MLDMIMHINTSKPDDRCYGDLHPFSMLQQYVLFVGDVRKTADTNEVLGLAPKLPVKHPGSITDLQVGIQYRSSVGL